MRISDKNFLKNLLDYLTWNENEYNFFITNFSFPIEKSWPYKINIPLKMYIK
jgi:RNA-binding protein YlmH